MTGYGTALFAGAAVLLFAVFGEWLYEKMNRKSQRKYSRAVVRMIVLGVLLIVAICTIAFGG